MFFVLLYLPPPYQERYTYKKRNELNFIVNAMRISLPVMYSTTYYSNVILVHPRGLMGVPRTTPFCLKRWYAF
jgi:hypothetical protein